MLPLTLCFFIAVTPAISSADGKPFPLNIGEDDPYRLPTSVLPAYYEITLLFKENFGPNGVFSGSVFIVMKIQEAVQQITLHAQNLTINPNNVFLVCGIGDENLFSSLTYDSVYHKLTIVSKRVLSTIGGCILQIEDYEGILSDDMRGVYRSSYTNKNGEIE